MRILMVISIEEQLVDAVKEFLENEEFPGKELHFLVDSRENVFSYNSFQKVFSDSYYRIKPSKVVFLTQKEFGGDDHLLYAKVTYFENHFSRKIPFETYMAMYEEAEEALYIEPVIFKKTT